MYLSKEAILKARELPTKDVEVPEWGGTVRVRTLNGVERDAFDASFVDRKGTTPESRLANVRARLVASCVVDSEGNRVFTDEDAAALGQQSSRALDRVYTVAAELNGLGSKDAEELAGN